MQSAWSSLVVSLPPENIVNKSATNKLQFSDAVVHMFLVVRWFAYLYVKILMKYCKHKWLCRECLVMRANLVGFDVFSMVLGPRKKS